ncbi:M61 family peptidase [uncultured Algoriphagus sp.]|uniref:M61 family metallopeptidase n=1 Tax=uncultured Algoriphagus sp. TaxID=417365 RepID=UPI0030EF5E8D
MTCSSPKCILLLVLILFARSGDLLFSQQVATNFHYRVSIDDPQNQKVQVNLNVWVGENDTVTLKMPNWMPGYYQLMNYSEQVSNVIAKGEDGTEIPITELNSNTWQLKSGKNSEIMLSYEVKADKKFVANSLVDSTHAYLIPAGLFMYLEGEINRPVSVTVDVDRWTDVATGLKQISDDKRTYFAEDFDVLYDSPFLIGELEELPSFEVKGVEHRFIGYEMGEFDRVACMQNLKKVVESSVEIMRDIPFEEYTFIAIGPGRGGIEHLNNTTVSFDGKQMEDKEGVLRMMNFLAHEYFHHYNVKRIRPFELGPFDYDKGTKTNLLWVSEGLSVYYEYLVTLRGGLMSEKELFENLESNINEFENDPGKVHQSLVEASFATWGDGPFGTMAKGPDRSISYYAKGPVVGMLLDFAIRNASENKLSLDDVMRRLYTHYYQNLGRGFTDAEFQQTCEEMAGIPLTEIFEYVYTTKELDYDTFLGYAGLEIKANKKGTVAAKFTISRMNNLDSLQSSILNSWLEGK